MYCMRLAACVATYVRCSKSNHLLDSISGSKKAHKDSLLSLTDLNNGRYMSFSLLILLDSLNLAPALYLHRCVSFVVFLVCSTSIVQMLTNLQGHCNHPQVKSSLSYWTVSYLFVSFLQINSLHFCSLSSCACDGFFMAVFNIKVKLVEFKEVLKWFLLCANWIGWKCAINNLFW